MIKPERKPQEFGFKKNDTHLVVNSEKRIAKGYSFEGDLVFTIEALTLGSHAIWEETNGDTPPGLYKIGDIYNDYKAQGNGAKYNRTLASFGWVSFDLVDLEGNEDDSGRAGLMIHGGGSGLGWNGAWQPYQKLLPTYGCIRCHNKDLYDLLLPCTEKGTVFVSVYQIKY